MSGEGADNRAEGKSGQRERAGRGQVCVYVCMGGVTLFF